MNKPTLTIPLLCTEAQAFAVLESQHREPKLYGVTDGKAIGTYLEQKFRAYLQQRYEFVPGNSANGIDFPGLDVDMKVTSAAKPQSSCPFRSVLQKIYGLGYGLLVFVYDKSDDDATRTATLDINDTVYVERHRTGDFLLTQGLRNILLEKYGGIEDVVDFLAAQGLSSNGPELRNLAEHIFSNVPEQGFLTISPAFQWRLNYNRAIDKAGQEPGVWAVHRDQ